VAVFPSARTSPSAQSLEAPEQPHHPPGSCPPRAPSPARRNHPAGISDTAGHARQDGRLEEVEIVVAHSQRATLCTVFTRRNGQGSPGAGTAPSWTSSPSMCPMMATAAVSREQGGVVGEFDPADDPPADEGRFGGPPPDGADDGQATMASAMAPVMRPATRSASRARIGCHLLAGHGAGQAGVQASQPASRQTSTRSPSEGSRYAVAGARSYAELSPISDAAPGTTCGNHRADFPRAKTSPGMVSAVQVHEPTSVAWARSLVHFALQARGHWFEPSCAHNFRILDSACRT
jgi:hypothetical protein